MESKEVAYVENINSVIAEKTTDDVELVPESSEGILPVEEEKIPDRYVNDNHWNWH
jgi:hypothetical protein